MQMKDLSSRDNRLSESNGPRLPGAGLARSSREEEKRHSLTRGVELPMQAKEEVDDGAMRREDAGVG